MPDFREPSELIRREFETPPKETEIPELASAQAPAGIEQGFVLPKKPETEADSAVHNEIGPNHPLPETIPPHKHAAELSRIIQDGVEINPGKKGVHPWEAMENLSNSLR